MVVVLAARLDMEVAAHRHAQRLEEVAEHLGRHVAHILARKGHVPNEVGPPAEIEQHHGTALVHRQHESVTVNRLPESYGRILDGVVLVHLQIASALRHERHARVVRDLVEHVIEKLQTRIDMRTARTVEIDHDADVGLGRFADRLRATFGLPQELRHVAPVHGHEHAARGIMFPRQHLAAVLGTLQQNGFRAEVERQLHIGGAVTYNIAPRKIVIAAEILSEHPRPRLARGGVVLGHRAVDELIGETHALALQRAQHLGVRGPKGLLGKRRRTQSVLIGRQNQLVIELRDRSQRRYGARDEL